jgi:phosphatidylglycerol lysyltransferase
VQRPPNWLKSACDSRREKLNFLFGYSGLRQYKAKFATIWEPRYTVYGDALDLPRLALALGKVSEIES